MPGSIDEINAIFEDLERCVFDVVNGVQDSKEIRAAAFERTEQLSKQLTALLKGHELIPRYILERLSHAGSILQNEASHMRTNAEQQKTLQMAAAIITTSNLIIGGECHNDRRPGVPRII